MASGRVSTKRVERDWLFSFTKESEQVLRSLMGLFQEESAQCTPDDLLLMSDMPGRELWVARVDGEVVAGCELTFEGKNVSRARKEAVAVNWLIKNTYPMSGFEEQSGVRVEHIGGEWCYAEALLASVIENLAAESREVPIQYIGVKCEVEHFQRYRALGFRPVAMMEPAESLRYNVVLLRPIDENDHRCDVFAAHFLRHFIYWLSSMFRDLPAETLIELLKCCSAGQKAVCKKGKYRAELARADIDLFLNERALKRLTRVDPSSVHSMRANMDVIRALCLLHFGAYIHQQKLKPRVAELLIELGLQNKFDSFEAGTVTEEDVAGLKKFFDKGSLIASGQK